MNAESPQKTENEEEKADLVQSWALLKFGQESSSDGGTHSLKRTAAVSASTGRKGTSRE
ncbi:unnamed protein product [Dovyalis caffra]|uniref:Uncharacterized protein n=1 Tax=Dovyalis caffra TaxID=77055 RepID=A0AAV1RSZ0_9ROSI|nr:unnamed protein product [Dovyalis caffra]